MSDKTKVEWADASWNWAKGCSRVGADCDHCYAIGMARRQDSEGGYYEGTTRYRNRLVTLNVVTGETEKQNRLDWTGEVTFNPDALEIPMHWRKPRYVFTNSMSDAFHESLTNEQIAAAFAVMAMCHWHTFQVLTKRTKRAADWFAWFAVESERRSGPGGVLETALGTFVPDLDEDAACALVNVVNGWARYRNAPDDGRKLDGSSPLWPLPNVHLVASAGYQEALDDRLPWLLRCPAAIHGLSLEPLIGPINLAAHLGPCKYVHEHPGMGVCQHAKIDWVIAGGESGSQARECVVEWLLAIAEDCKRYGAKLFLKQLGSRSVMLTDDTGAPYTKPQPSPGKGKRSNMLLFPHELRVREMPPA